MKKIGKRTLALVLVLSMLIIPCATAFETVANNLNGLGLFLGDDGGYRLEAELTRAEGAALVVRLLGLEGSDTDTVAPFTDLPDWAAPYVHILYSRDLIAGVSETEFDPDAPMSIQMFVTLILRVLGYSDAEGGDFTFDTAIPFGMSVSLIDPINAPTKTLTRGHAAAIAYTALSLSCSGEDSETLLEALVADGAISDADAEDMLKLFTDYNKLFAALTESDFQNSCSFEMTADFTMSENLSGETIAVALTGNVDILVNEENPLNSLAAMTFDFDIDGQVMAFNIYMADEKLYIETNAAIHDPETETDIEIKERYYMLLSEYMPEGLDFAATNNGGSAISIISALNVTETDGNSRYDISYDTAALESAVNAIFLSAIAAMGEVADAELGLTMGIDDMSIYYVLDQNDAPSEMGAELVYNISMPIAAAGTTIVLIVNAEMDMQMKILATGEAVEVTLPVDLDEYPSISDMFTVETIEGETVEAETVEAMGIEEPTISLSDKLGASAALIGIKAAMSGF